MSQLTREQQSRVAQLRQTLERQGRLDVNISGLSADLEACWITTHVRGEPVDSNPLDAFERGYRVATFGDIPTIRMPDVQGKKMDASSEIRRPDCVLMVREKYLGDFEREYRRKLSAAAVDQAHHEVETLDAEKGGAALDFRYIQPRRQNRLRVSDDGVGPPRATFEE